MIQSKKVRNLFIIFLFLCLALVCVIFRNSPKYPKYFHGMSLERFSNNSPDDYLEKNREWINKKTSGRYQLFYPDGKIEIEGNIRNGYFYGEQRIYFPDGNYASIYYEDGNVNFGEMSSEKVFDRDGNLIHGCYYPIY